MSRTIVATLLIAIAAASGIQPAKAASQIQLTPLLPSINLGGTEPLLLTLQNKAPLKSYTFVIKITSPGGYQSSASTQITTNTAGDGNKTLNYATDFSAYPKPPDTNQTGTYSVRVFEMFDEGVVSLVAASSFPVDSRLTINILHESGADFLPGEPFNLSVEVRDVNNRSYVPAQVIGSISGTSIFLRFNSTSTGVYEAVYAPTSFIPQDSHLTIYAYDTAGNAGQTVITLSPTYSGILVGKLEVTDQQGVPARELSPGEIVHFGFRATYTNGTLVRSGEAKVSILNGNLSRTILQAQYYDPTALFVTTQGFKLPENSSSVTLAVKVLMVDAAGIPGSSAPVTLSLTMSNKNVFSYFTLLPGVIVLAGSGVSLYTLRRTRRQLSMREFREALLQNKKHSVLIAGRKKAGMSSILTALLREDLNSGVSTIYINFEMTLSRLISHMINNGIDLLECLRKNSLRILDCSDLNVSLDLTNLRPRIAGALADIHSENFSLYIDSLTLPFEDLPTDQVVAFLWGLSDEVIRERGTIYSTVRLTKIVKKNLPSIREVFDSLFEIRASNTRSKQTKLSLVGVSESMKRTPIGELKVTADSKVEMQVPLASSLEKKIKES